MASLKTTTAPQFTSDNPATAPGHVPRLDQVQALVAGVSPSAHVHVSGDITDFNEASDSRIGGYFNDSQSIDFSGAVATVRLKSGGGVLVGVDGLEIDPAVLSPVAHTHAQLHDPATVLSSATLSFSIAGQEVSAGLILATGSGLVVTDGVGVNFGTGASQAARGDHTHGQLHDPLTVLSTDAILFGIVGQVITATVRRSPASAGKIPIAEDPDGLHVANAAGGVAAYVHTHPDASVSDPGFMSAADKLLLTKLRYEHSQNSATNVWSVVHNLGRRPVVTVLDDAGEKIYGEERHVSANEVEVEFNGNMTGSVLCV